VTATASDATEPATPAAVRAALLAGDEIALLDVRPEAVFAQGHPLFAASLPLDRLELEVLERIPRAATPLVVYGDDAGQAQRARARLAELGYRDVRGLERGLKGWVAAGGELFADVNAPSKAFGELVAERLRTPSIDPGQLRRLLDAGADVTVLDARRFEEYRTMSIPAAASAPGATLVRHVCSLGDGDGLVVVNCAGRTRSIIGAQTLINAGAARRVVALRNGTIGWTLAGLTLDTGQTRRADGPLTERALVAARQLADRAGVRRLDGDRLERLSAGDRTVYRFDVRSPAAFREGHLAGFRSAPGGQLVQQTDCYAPVRGARIVLADDGGTEADVTGSWLAQMGWEVTVLDGVRAGDGPESGPGRPRLPSVPAIESWSPAELAFALHERRAAVLDVGRYEDYRNGHIGGARWVSRSPLLAGETGELPVTETYVVTAREPELIGFAVADLDGRLPARVVGLEGGTGAWAALGTALATGDGQPLSVPQDRYRRPYEGTDAPAGAMHAYLEWEYGLVEQLARDGTHHFRPLPAG
jgi:rhodanese-related sulfurtransferase